MPNTSGRPLRTLPYGIKARPALPSARTEARRPEPAAPPKAPKRASRPSLSEIDEGWGEPEREAPAQGRRGSVRRSRCAAEARGPIPRPALAATPALFLPVVELPPEPRPEAKTLEDILPATPLSSVVGVPTLHELVELRAEARLRAEDEAPPPTRPAQARLRTAPILFPEQATPRPTSAPDLDARRAMFAYGALSGAVAVALAVLVAVVLR
jgi:hypothetical protein